MNRKNTILSLFAVLVVVQLAVPLSMIQKREMTLRNGAQYKFRTAPVDPADAFRGRYVALRLDEQTVWVPEGTAFRHGQKAYAAVSNDVNGFARIGQLAADRPRVGTYVPVTVSYVYGTNAQIQLPFDRYYMTETKAPQAEAAYWSHSRRTNQTTYVTVRVLNGFAVLEELYIDDLPIKDFLKKEGGK